MKAPALFPRIEKEEHPMLKKPTHRQEPPEELLAFKEFQRIDLRVATIKAAEPIPGSKKLLKLTIDLGEERTVVAGLVGHYEPKRLTGKQVLIVANLEPVKLMGIESKGMVLAAEDEQGLHLLVPDSKTTAGSKVK